MKIFKFLFFCSLTIFLSSFTCEECDVRGTGFTALAPERSIKDILNLSDSLEIAYQITPEHVLTDRTSVDLIHGDINVLTTIYSIDSTGHALPTVDDFNFSSTEERNYTYEDFYSTDVILDSVGTKVSNAFIPNKTGLFMLQNFVYGYDFNRCFTINFHPLQFSTVDQNFDLLFNRGIETIYFEEDSLQLSDIDSTNFFFFEVIE